MNITVKLHAGLRNNRFQEKILSVPVKSNIKSLLEKLEFTEDDVAIIFINNCHADISTIINADDIIALFPPTGGG